MPSASRGLAIGVAVRGLYGVHGLGALGAGPGAEGVSAGAVVALVGGLGALAALPPLVARARLQSAARTGTVAGTAVPAGPWDI